MNQEREVARATAALWRADPDLRRDRWGHEHSIDHLEILARYTLVNRPGLTMADLTNAIILAMLTGLDDVPLICQGYDEPADDDQIETLVRIILDGAGVPHPEPGVREA